MPEFLDLHGRTSKALRALADAAMRRHGLHLGQNHLLAELWERDGSTPGQVAAALSVSTPTVVKMADRMTAAGLLTRRRDLRDSRLVRLWLTDAGRALREPVEAERRVLEERVTAGLSEAEREQLLSALHKIDRAARDLLGTAAPPRGPAAPGGPPSGGGPTGGGPAGGPTGGGRTDGPTGSGRSGGASGAVADGGGADGDPVGG